MTLRRLVPIPLLVAIFAIVVTIAACGGDESPDATTTTTQAVATSTATSIPTVTSTPTVGDPLSLAEAYYSAYNTQDIEALASIFADEVVLSFEPGISTLLGKEQVIDQQASENLTRSRDQFLQSNIDSLVKSLCRSN